MKRLFLLPFALALCVAGCSSTPTEHGVNTEPSAPVFSSTNRVSYDQQTLAKINDLENRQAKLQKQSQRAYPKNRVRRDQFRAAVMELANNLRTARDLHQGLQSLDNAAFEARKGELNDLLLKTELSLENTRNRLAE